MGIFYVMYVCKDCPESLDLGKEKTYESYNINTKSQVSILTF
jgi:hypothetical protein